MIDGGAQAGSLASRGEGARGAVQGGSAVRRKEIPEDPPGGAGGRVFTAAGDGGGTGSRTPKSRSPRLESPCDAKERPSFDGHQTTPTVPAGVVGGEAASWG